MFRNKIKKNPYISIILILYYSFFSFLHTEKASPVDIEDSCFDIDQALVNVMYLGNSLCSKYVWCVSPINFKINQRSSFGVYYVRIECKF